MNKIIYSKFSNDRGRQFKIRTDILEDATGKKCVVKSALTEEAIAHIHHIDAVYNKLSEKYNGYAEINKCELTDACVELEFLQGNTLDQEINRLYAQGQEEAILALLKQYVEFVSYAADKEPFVVTEDFLRVFGDVKLPDQLLSTSVADIDLIFENILINDNAWNVIDYEWTFLFPVPVNFIIYRGIAAFAEGLYAESDKRIEGIDLYEFCNITKEEIVVYKTMINNFERYVMQGGCTMKNIHGMLAAPIYNPEKAVKDLYGRLGKFAVQVFGDYGKGYDEEKSYFIAPTEENYENVELKIELEDNCQSLRIDPAIGSCIFHITGVYVDDIAWDNYETNGYFIQGNTVLYDHSDPQVCVHGLEGKKTVKLQGTLKLTEADDIKNVIACIENCGSTIRSKDQEIANRDGIIHQQNLAMQELHAIIGNLNTTIDNLNGAIHAIENSPSWKLTAPLRKAKKIAKKILRRNPATDKVPVAEMPVDTFANETAEEQTEIQERDPKETYIEYVMQIPDTSAKNIEYVEDIEDQSLSLTANDVKYVAFYLPQFHAFPENDAWWGKNFMEWTNVTKAVPMFEKHYQPRLAGDLGYYHLDEKKAIKQQMELAKKYGVYGFCIYYYWFDGKKLMDTPLNIIMENPELDLPFCLCWANENWSRRWDGKESDILMAQNYNDSFAHKFIADICPYMKDKRYIRRNGKPVLVIYNSNEIPNLKEVIVEWREYCRNHGIGEIHISAVDFALNELSKGAGFDDFIEFPPHSVYHYDKRELSRELSIMNPDFGGSIYDYHEIVNNKEYIKRAQENVIPGVFLAWDNTARKKNAATIYHNYSPADFGEWLSDVSSYEIAMKDKGDRFVFINAWNEWAEGTYLEPDRKYGYAALTQVRNTIQKLRKQKSIIYVSHDACFNGAQMLSLNIIKTLKETYGYDVYVILKGNGALKQEFYECAYEVICLEDEQWTNEQLEKWIYATGAKIAICNTTVSGDLVENLAKADVCTLSLIHEMEKIIKEHNIEGNLEVIAKYAHKIVFASEYVRKSCDNVYALPEDKVMILPQGMYKLNSYLDKREEVKASLYEKYGIDKDHKLVIGVGYGDYRKGVDLFVDSAIEVIKKDDKVTYMWVGDLSPEMEKVKEERINGSEYEKRVKFVGKQTDPMLYYAAADLFLLTSREDPFPTVVMEAMYSYLPVIAFKEGGGYVEIVNDKTGGLVDYEDCVAMANLVLEYVNNPERMEKTGCYVHDFVAKKYKFASYVGELLGLLNQEIPSISVVVPNYNYANYLKERIESILIQDYPIKEIILLDDCSKDNSREILDAYAEQYPTMVKTYFNEQNAGNVFKQWSKGFELATGDYVWIAEADDLSDSQFLRRVMGMLNANQDMVMCYSQSKMMDENGNITGDNYFCYTDDVNPNGWVTDYVHDAQEELKEHMTVKNTIPNVSGVVFKQGDYSEILHNAMAYTVAGDWRVYADILAKGGSIGFVADSLNYHRRHSNSVTTDLKAEKHYSEIVEMQEYVAKILGMEVDVKMLKYREYLKEYFGL